MESTDLVGFLDHWNKINKNGFSNSGNSSTSNVTIITPKTNLVELKAFVASEIATSRNIKSALNRKAVGESLRSIQMKLKSIKELPSNGIVMYAGQCI
jgi:peptide subunit release factor 1 (eRF1)